MLAVNVVCELSYGSLVVQKNLQSCFGFYGLDTISSYKIASFTFFSCQSRLSKYEQAYKKSGCKAKGGLGKSRLLSNVKLAF